MAEDARVEPLIVAWSQPKGTQLERGVIILRRSRTKTRLVTAVSVEDERPVGSFILLGSENEGAELVGSTGQADRQGSSSSVDRGVVLAIGIVSIRWRGEMFHLIQR